MLAGVARKRWCAVRSRGCGILYKYKNWNYFPFAEFTNIQYQIRVYAREKKNTYTAKEFPFLYYTNRWHFPLLTEGK